MNIPPQAEHGPYGTSGPVAGTKKAASGPGGPAPAGNGGTYVLTTHEGVVDEDLLADWLALLRDTRGIVLHAEEDASAAIRRIAEGSDARRTCEEAISRIAKKSVMLYRLRGAAGDEARIRRWLAHDCHTACLVNGDTERITGAPLSTSPGLQENARPRYAGGGNGKLRTHALRAWTGGFRELLRRAGVVLRPGAGAGRYEVEVVNGSHPRTGPSSEPALHFHGEATDARTEAAALLRAGVEALHLMKVCRTPGGAAAAGDQREETCRLLLKRVNRAHEIGRDSFGNGFRWLGETAAPLTVEEVRGSPHRVTFTPPGPLAAPTPDEAGDAATGNGNLSGTGDSGEVRADAY